MYKLIGIDTEEEEGDTGYFGFRPVGFGQMIWEPILDASIKANANWVIVEQDEHYEMDPLECARRSSEYLKILGWQNYNIIIDSNISLKYNKEGEKRSGGKAVRAIRMN